MNEEHDYPLMMNFPWTIVNKCSYETYARRTLDRELVHNQDKPLRNLLHKNVP